MRGAVILPGIQRLHAPRLVLMTGAGLLSVMSSWLICAPPLTRTLFGRYLGIVQPPDIRELQRWDANWARDRAYFLQFSASPKRLMSSCDERDYER
jgi:hypothetical protein